MRSHTVRRILLASIFLPSLAASQPSWDCDRTPLAVTNVRLWDSGETTKFLIADGVIRALGDLGTAPRGYADVRTLDGGGAMVLPGLIDSHTHFDALPAAKHLQSELDVPSEIFPITMRQTLASGVTTARAHLSAFEDMRLMKALSEDDCFPSPRIVVSGPGILGGAPEVEGRLMRGIDGADEARAAIARLAENGADWVALHGLSRFDESELDALTRAAAESGLRLMADTDAFTDLRVALERPVVSGEYLNRTTETAYPDEVLSALATREPALFVVPPVGYYRRSHALATSSVPRIDSNALLFVGDDLAREMQRRFAEDLATDEYIAQIAESFDTHHGKLRQLGDAGATFVVGSDSGSLGQFHHDAIWQELASWRAFGFSVDDVLASATSVPARMLDRADIGTVASGMRGDVVLVDAAAAGLEFEREHLRAVIKGGVIFVRDSEWVGPNRDEMVAHIESFATPRD